MQPPAPADEAALRARLRAARRARTPQQRARDATALARAALEVRALAALGAADVVLLPAPAVDLSGTRLGQGGGHDDRTLALLGASGAASPRPLLVAVVHAEEVLAAGALPRRAHDAPVDAALTPAGLVPPGDHPGR